MTKEFYEKCCSKCPNCKIDKGSCVQYCWIADRIEGGAPWGFFTDSELAMIDTRTNELLKINEEFFILPTRCPFQLEYAVSKQI